jgi:hypothetical protein
MDRGLFEYFLCSVKKASARKGSMAVQMAVCLACPGCREEGAKIYLLMCTAME